MGRSTPEAFAARASQEEMRKQWWKHGALHMDDQREKITLCLLTDICSFKTPLLLSSPCLPKPTLLGISLKRVCETCNLYANAMVGEVMNIPSACGEGT